jgi:hypothetical protein
MYEIACSSERERERERERNDQRATAAASAYIRRAFARNVKAAKVRT